MADFVAIEYDDMFKAHEVRLTLTKLQRESLIDVDDAVVAVKDDNGKVTLYEARVLTPAKATSAEATSGDFWHTLVGALFSARFLGAVSVADSEAGAVSSALSDVGIDGAFIKQLSDGFKPGTSALFVLVRNVTPDRVLEEIKPYGGTILQTSLSHEREEKLRGALEAVQAATNS